MRGVSNSKALFGLLKLSGKWEERDRVQLAFFTEFLENKSISSMAFAAFDPSMSYPYGGYVQ